MHVIYVEGMAKKKNTIPFNPVDALEGEYRKDFIEARKDEQVRIGTSTYKMPAEMEGNEIAIEKWKEITAAYKKANLTNTSSTDSPVIARYCLLYSEYCEMIERENRVPEVTILSADLIKAFVKMDNQKNKKALLLLQYERELFLTPLSKFKNIPASVKGKQKTPLEKAGFGNI